MKTQTENLNWFDNQAAKFEENRFGAMTFMMTFQSCLGSIAAMAALYKDNYVLLSIIAAMTMASNAAFISQSPAKWCIGIFYGSVGINIVLLIISAFI